MNTGFLSSATMVDSAHPAVAEFSRRHRGASGDPREQAVSASWFAVPQDADFAAEAHATAHQPDKRGA